MTTNSRLQHGLSSQEARSRAMRHHIIEEMQLPLHLSAPGAGKPNRQTLPDAFRVVNPAGGRRTRSGSVHELTRFGRVSRTSPAPSLPQQPANLTEHHRHQRRAPAPAPPDPAPASGAGGGYGRRAVTEGVRRRRGLALLKRKLREPAPVNLVAATTRQSTKPPPPDNVKPLLSCLEKRRTHPLTSNAAPHIITPDSEELVMREGSRSRQSDHGQVAVKVTVAVDAASVSDPHWGQPQTQEETFQCSICSRSFVESSYTKHRKLCKKVFKTKRKRYNSTAHRRPEGAPPLHVPRRGKARDSIDSRARKPAINGVPLWKQQSQQLREALKAARQYTKRESGKGKLSEKYRERGSAATEAPRGSNALSEAGGSSKSRPFLQRGGGRGAHMRSGSKGKKNTTSSTSYSTTTFARNRSTRMY